jgi:hypothetical protein
MQIDLRYAGKQEHNSFIVRREPGDICGQRVSSRRCAFASAVKTGLDDLLWEPNGNGYYTLEYADDIAILMNGNFLLTMSYKENCAQSNSG